MGDERVDYGMLQLRMTFQLDAIAAAGKNPTSGIEMLLAAFAQGK